MKRRPHKIQFKVYGVSGGTDEWGDPLPPKDEWSEPVSCHYSNSNTYLSRQIYQHQGGSDTVYDYVVYLDQTPTNYVGVTVRLFDQHGNIREAGKTVQKCVNGQLSTILYL